MPRPARSRSPSATASRSTKSSATRHGTGSLGTSRSPDLAKRCNAVCFGTLGQRLEPARSTIQKFAAAASQAVRLFDLNLRQDYFSAELLEAGCRAASIVKMNEAELATVAPLLGLGQAEEIQQLIEHFDLDLFVLTRGKLGTALHTGELGRGWPAGASSTRTRTPIPSARATPAAQRSCTGRFATGRFSRPPTWPTGSGRSSPRARAPRQSFPPNCCRTGLANLPQGEGWGEGEIRLRFKSQAPCRAGKKPRQDWAHQPARQQCFPWLFTPSP